ncbi:MAG: DUF368 domain-containing protein [Clostridia bacterium]|nr:DUF368 domain-containing protein [Clostridia bacterium]
MASKTTKNEMSLFQILYRVMVGMVFGLANIIPGVSGGTAMVVFGVYERIILIITDFRSRIKTEWKFFLPILAGMGIAVFLFGSLMDVMLTNNEAIMQTFFIGVIAFSVPMIAKKAAGSLSGKRNLTKDIVCVLIFAVILALMIWMSTVEKVEGEEIAATGSWIIVSVKMIIYGAIACATMIIPGISGSLVMVMLGCYGQIMAALHTFNIAQLIPFGIGMLLGMVFCAKLIKFLLNRFSRETYSAILGFVVGSVFAIFPGWSYIAPVIAFSVGAAAIVACERLAKKFS